MNHFDISDWIQKIVLLLPGFLLAITCHEAAHGYAAYRLGDPTPKLAGRLTLNPLKHLDLVGTLVLVLTRMIGWAKPVPIDPRYFKDPYKGMMLTSLAGPGANFLLSFLLAIAFGFSANATMAATGSLSLSILRPLTGILQYGLFINLVLAIFNLIPIPPLDGSKVLAYFLPRDLAARYLGFGRYGFIVVIILAVSGLLGEVLGPPLDFFLGIYNSMLQIFF